MRLNKLHFTSHRRIKKSSLTGLTKNDWLAQKKFKVKQIFLENMVLNDSAVICKTKIIILTYVGKKERIEIKTQDR
jgi:hypothetical protein